jgi:metal-responsive CopG/Arc/MetJ family transcriptional regulator
MALQKTAIAVPKELLAAVDQAARERNESRNRFVNRVLEQAVRARRDADITRRLNQLFLDPEVTKEQRRVAEQLDQAGTDWAEEGW